MTFTEGFTLFGGLCLILAGIATFRILHGPNARAVSAYSPGTCEYPGCTRPHTTADHDAAIEATDTLFEFERPE